MAKVAAIITVTIVAANAPPQYTGPGEINDLVIGIPRQLEGFDPDGDPIVWSVEDNPFVSVSPDGVLTPLTAVAGAAITVFLDDGKP